MKCGGTSEEKPANEEIQTLIDKSVIKDEAVNKYGKDFAKYIAVSYTSQVVAGTNYFVKVDVGNGEFVHMRIFIPLPHVNGLPSLTNIKLGKSESDPINYF